MTRARITNFIEYPEQPLSPDLLEDEEKLLEATLYVHLAADGRILILPGNRLRTQWVTRDVLEAELERIRELGGVVLYSRDHPEQAPPDVVLETFERIASYKMPMKLVAEAHPDTMES